MKKTLVVGILLFWGIFCSYSTLYASNSDIIINEIQITGSTGHSNDDFIEIYNPSSETIDITNWKLEKIIKSGTKSVIKTFSTTPNKKIIIPSNGYLLWANSAGAFISSTLEDFTSSAILSNDYSIGLFDEENNLIDALTYGTGHALFYNPSILYLTNPTANTSLERNLENNSFFLQNQPSPQNNAFIEENIIEDDPEEITPPPNSQEKIELKINEIFPNPSEKEEENEFIEIFNYGTLPLDISGFSLKDASKSSGYTFPSKSLLPAQEYLVIYKKDSNISLNNSDEKVFLLDKNSLLIDSLTYQETKEGSSFGFDENENKFRWSKNITPGEMNIFNPAPSGKENIPKKSYKNFPTEFSASGSSDYDYSWDFGDGGKSTKQKTTHTYKGKGIFKGFLTIDNGTEEKKIDFEIKIEKYPKKSLDIIGILPNPEGSDSDNEYIIIKNNEKKSIDLSDWSIATGSNKNKFTNHPFTKSITIKKGEEKIIHNKYSNFSLPNQKGFIELRQPDGKTVDKASYNKEGSIDENELYKLQSDKNWLWIKQSTTKIAETEPSNQEKAAEKTPTFKFTRLEDLSTDDRSELEKQVEEKLREKIYIELEEKYENEIKNDPAVLGSTDSNKNIEKPDSPLLKFKKSLKNIFLKANLHFENIFK